MGRALGAVRGAKGVVHVDVAQCGHLARQGFVVFLLTLVDAAVLEQNHLAGQHVHTTDPVGHQRHVAAEQLAQAFGHRCQRILGFELALGGAAQVARDHHGRTGVQSHLDAGHAGADACVFSDAAVIGLRHVQVGADEHAFASGKAIGAHVRKSQEVHGGLPISGCRRA